MSPFAATSIRLADELAAVGERLRRITVRVATGHGVFGSGVIWRPGVVVTNAHVANSQQLMVEFDTGEQVQGELMSRDSKRDLAVITVPPGNGPAATIRSTSSLRAGELVIAAGSPMGVPRAITVGILHSRGTEERGIWISADLHLAPGNSGGPLADAEGRVIGVNSMVVNGVGVAIAADAVERWLERVLPQVAAAVG